MDLKFLFYLKKWKNVFKGSVRSKEFVDVSKVCSYFNGGGHTRAAGCIIDGDFESVVNLF